MTTIYNRTDYVMLPRIQAARALKREIRQGGFSNWCLGRATAFRFAAQYCSGNRSQYKVFREMMRNSATDSVRDARAKMELSR